MTEGGKNIGPGMGVAAPLPGRWGSVAGEPIAGMDVDDVLVWREMWLEGVDPDVEVDAEAEVEVGGAGLGCDDGADRRLANTGFPACVRIKYSLGG